jgi:colanic acid biosynthesis glycosyl transferase WcaI
LVYFPIWIDVRPFDQPLDREATRARFGLGQSDFVLLHVGTLGVRTSAETLLEAMKLLRDHPRISLVFAGGGNMRAVIQGMASEMGLDRVRFIDGILQQEDLIALVRSSDLLVLSQKANVIDSVLPSKLLTYMASRRPVLASVHSSSEAAQFILRSGGGRVTEAENGQAFAEATLALESQPEICAGLGEAGRRFVEATFERAMVLQHFEAKLNALLTKTT